MLEEEEGPAPAVKGSSLGTFEAIFERLQRLQRLQQLSSSIWRPLPGKDFPALKFTF